MSLVRWQPMRPLMRFGDLQNRVNRIFDEFWHDDDMAMSTWSPRIEVSEADDDFEITAELPGMKKEDVKVEVRENVLTLSGEKKLETEKKDRHVYMCERSYGSFSRSFQLPAAVDVNRIEARFKDGVLELKVPKVEEAKPKQISIDVK